MHHIAGGEPVTSSLPIVEVAGGEEFPAFRHRREREDVEERVVVVEGEDEDGAARAHRAPPGKRSVMPGLDDRAVV